MHSGTIYRDEELLRFEGKSQGLSITFLNNEMPMRYPRGHFKEVVVYVSVELRGLLWVADLDLGAIKLRMVLKPLRMHIITYERV